MPRIQLRRGSLAEWAAANPLLANGEVGVEYDTRKLKVGDGLTLWNSLPYIGIEQTLIDALDARLDTIEGLGTLATEAYVDTAVDTLVGTAPGALDTLQELSAALADDANFATTITTQLGALDARLDTIEAVGTLASTTYVDSAVAAVGDTFIEMDEQATDPAAPAADKARLFVRDDGAGKTQLCVLFATGSAIVLATEA